MEEIAHGKATVTPSAGGTTSDALDEVCGHTAGFLIALRTYPRHSSTTLEQIVVSATFDDLVASGEEWHAASRDATLDAGASRTGPAIVPL